MPEPAFPIPQPKKPESIEVIPDEDVLSVPESSVDATTRPKEAVDPIADTERGRLSDIDLPSVREGDAPPFSGPDIADTERDVDIPVSTDLSGLEEQEPEIHIDIDTGTDTEQRPAVRHRPHWMTYPEGHVPAKPNPSNLRPKDRINLQPPAHELRAMKKEYQAYGSREPDSEEPLTNPLNPVPPVSVEEVRPEEGVPSRRTPVSGHPDMPPHTPSVTGRKLSVSDTLGRIGLRRDKISRAPVSEISGRRDPFEPVDSSKPPYAPSELNPIESDEDRKEFGGEEEEGRAEVA